MHRSTLQYRMRSFLRYLFKCLSTLFFELNVLLYKDTPQDYYPCDHLPPWVKFQDGIFIGPETIDGKVWGLFANTRIGFFYKDRVHIDDLSPGMATPEEITELREYLANKISEYQELNQKLDCYEVQPVQPIK